MTHAPVIALARAKAREKFPEDQCLVFVRTRFGVGALAGDAAEGFMMAKHRRHSVPPPGVPVWFTGGEHGHVAMSAGGGHVISTDWPRAGAVGRVKIKRLAQDWSKTYKGWSKDVNDVVVFVRPTVDLSALRQAAKDNPGDPHQGSITPGAGNDVRLVEAALFVEGLLDEKYAFDSSFGNRTLTAYAAWQRKIGLSGDQAKGMPDLTSLQMLGHKYAFKVQA